MSLYLACSVGEYNDHGGLNCTSKEPSINLFTLSVITKLNNVIWCYTLPLPRISTQSGQFLIGSYGTGITVIIFEGFDSRERIHSTAFLILPKFHWYFILRYPGAVSWGERKKKIYLFRTAQLGRLQGRSCFYLTIRLLALVFYEQIVNSAAPRWLSLLENEGEWTNCLSINL